jgi:large subunit ribosomal protein L17
MRHQKATIKLSRTSSHRSAMFKNMATSLFKYEQIRTTDAKAKELRRWADHLITLAKRGDLHARRQALSMIRSKRIVHQLFESAPERFGHVNGGYTRVVKLGRRPGDAALLSMVELVDFEAQKKEKRPKKKSKTSVDTLPPATTEESSDAATEKQKSEQKSALPPIEDDKKDTSDTGFDNAEEPSAQELSEDETSQDKKQSDETNA